jgi:hypothetical protein
VVVVVAEARVAAEVDAVAEVPEAVRLARLPREPLKRRQFKARDKAVADVVAGEAVKQPQRFLLHLEQQAPAHRQQLLVADAGRVVELMPIPTVLSRLAVVGVAAVAQHHGRIVLKVSLNTHPPTISVKQDRRRTASVD